MSLGLEQWPEVVARVRRDGRAWGNTLEIQEEQELRTRNPSWNCFSIVNPTRDLGLSHTHRIHPELLTHRWKSPIGKLSNTLPVRLGHPLSRWVHQFELQLFFSFEANMSISRLYFRLTSSRPKPYFIRKRNFFQKAKCWKGYFSFP